MTSETERADELAAAVSSAWQKELELDNRSYQPAAVNASSRKECLRAMMLNIVAWNKREPFPPAALERMKRGKEREKDIIARLMHIGGMASPRFEPIHQQQSESLKDRKGRIVIRMRIDGKFKFETGETPPFEIKSLNPNTAEGIHTVADFDKSHWTKHYVDQILCYLLAHNEPIGFFIMETRALPRIIPVILNDHLDRAESFLTDAEKIMDAVETWKKNGDEALLPYTKNTSLCRRCDFFGRACNPPLIFGEGAYVTTDSELVQRLDRRGELKDAMYPFGDMKKELESIDEEIKGRLEGKELTIAGDWEINGKWINRKEYTAKASKYFKLNIEKLPTTERDETKQAR